MRNFALFAFFASLVSAFLSGCASDGPKGEGGSDGAVSAPARAHEGAQIGAQADSRANAQEGSQGNAQGMARKSPQKDMREGSQVGAQSPRISNSTGVSLSSADSFSAAAPEGGSAAIASPSSAARRASPKMSMEDFSEKIALADTKNVSLARKKLLDILGEQARFYKRMGNDTRLKEIETLSAYRRIMSLWEGYFLENPNDVEARIIYGKFLRSTGKASDAYAEFCAADRLDPSIAVVKQQMATFEAETGRVKESYAHICDAVRIEPDNAVYVWQAAKLMVSRRDVLEEHLKLSPEEYDKKFLSLYARAAELEPTVASFQTDYALSFFDAVKKPDWNAALRQWKRVEKLAALNLDRQIVLANMARVLIELNRDDEAEKLLESVTLDSIAGVKSALLAEIERARKEGAARKVPERKTYSY